MDRGAFLRFLAMLALDVINNLPIFIVVVLQGFYSGADDQDNFPFRGIHALRTAYGSFDTIFFMPASYWTQNAWNFFEVKYAGCLLRVARHCVLHRVWDGAGSDRSSEAYWGVRISSEEGDGPRRRRE